MTEPGRTGAGWCNYLHLCRVSNLPTVWTNVLAAVVLSGAGFTLSRYLLLAGALSCFYAGGMCLNDLWDAAVDRVDKPGRPIPSGRVSLRGARALTVVLLLSGLGGLALVPHMPALAAGAVLLLVIVLYDRYHRDCSWSVLLMAACRFLVFVVAGLGASGGLEGAVLWAGLLQFLYVLVLSLVARWEKLRQRGYGFPVIPWMLAGVSLVDGLVLAALAAPVWLLAGVGGAVATLAGQRYVRGD
ncbi:MAG: UbiA family prenyltransferase [Deferrisomatales bacterium]|nr:UbiA family prenyltransferase [Deferrisomatales bacterium]